VLLAVKGIRSGVQGCSSMTPSHSSMTLPQVLVSAGMMQLGPPALVIDLAETSKSTV
jgi:hypothetical protein